MTEPGTTSEVRIQVRFTIERDGNPPYSDALYVPVADYESMLASGEIERQQEERYANHRAPIDNPVPAPDAQPVSQEDALAQARQAMQSAMSAIDAIQAASDTADQVEPEGS